jgi:hypothetical protein
MEPTEQQSAAAGLNAGAPVFAPTAAASGNFKLPDFWPEAPANWFAMAEAQFLLRRVTSNIDRFCHVLMALPKNSYRMISHLVTQAPAEDSYDQMKAALLSHHELSDYQRVDMLSRMEPLGGRKPSELLAAMLELCPQNQHTSPFFFYFFLQRLPREIRVLLSEESPADIRKVAEKADRLMVLHCPQHHDAVAAIPASSEDEADVAAVKQRSGKKFNGGKKRSKSGKAATADAARSSLCWYHARFGEKAHSCISPCSWAEN